MIIHKCDNCEQEISERVLRIDMGKFLAFVDLCYQCSEPLLHHLESIEPLRDSITKIRAKEQEAQRVAVSD